MKLCKCGCGKEIIIKPHHKYHGIPSFLKGHHIKLSNPMHREEIKEKIKGDKNPFYGKTHTLENRKNISNSRKGKFFKESNAWKGGCHYTLHLKAKEMFGKSECEECNVKEEIYIIEHKVGLSMHCQNGNHNDLFKDNWKTLCSKCHYDRHLGRKFL